MRLAGNRFRETITMGTSTWVTTAKGDLVEFKDFLSKFIAAHPRLSAGLALALGFAAGHWL